MNIIMLISITVNHVYWYMLCREHWNLITAKIIIFLCLIQLMIT